MAKPFYVEMLEKNDPQMLAQIAAMRAFIEQDGALPLKIKTLMCMLVDAILARPEGVRAIADRARTQGASEQEIAETIRIAFLFNGMPGMVTALEAFKK